MMLARRLQILADGEKVHASRTQVVHHLQHFMAFFAQAHLNPNAGAITGSVCGVRVEAIDDPIMKKIRYLDKLVDELAKGKPMAKVLRS